MPAGLSNSVHDDVNSWLSHFNKSDSNMFFHVEPDSMDVDTTLVDPNTDLYMDLSVNSVVEVNMGAGNLYGIIRWIGNLPGRPEIMAGLELVKFIRTCYCAD